MQNKTGTFTFATGVLTQTVTLGFKPKAIIFWSVGAVANNASGSEPSMSQGIWADCGNNVFRARSRWLRQTAASGPSSSYSASGDYGASTYGDIRNHAAGFNVTSISSTGFSILWKTAPTNGTIWHYYAIGGSEVQAYISPNVFDIAAGSPVGTKILLECPFIPSAMVVIGESDPAMDPLTNPIGLNFNNMIRGFMDGNGNQISAINYLVKATPANGNTLYASTAYSDTRVVITTGSGELTAQFVPSGVEFTVQVADNSNVVRRLNIDCLLLAGINSQVSMPTAPAANSTVNYATDFSPKGTLLMGWHFSGNPGSAVGNPISLPNSGAHLGGGLVFGAAETGTTNQGTSLTLWPSVTTTNTGLDRNDLALMWSDGDTYTNANITTFRRWISAVAASGRNLQLTFAGASTRQPYFGLMAFGDMSPAFTDGNINENDDFSASEFRYWLALTGDINEQGDLHAIGWGNVGNILGVGQITETELFKTDNTAPSKNGFGFDRTWSASNPAQIGYMTETDYFGGAGFGFLRELTGLITETEEFLASVFGRAWDGTGLMTEDATFTTGSTPATTGFGFTRLWQGAINAWERGYIEEQEFFDGYFRILLPTVRMPDRDEMAGTVNWHINPSVENGLIGWSAYGSGTITQAQDEAWDRGNSAHVSTAGLAADEGMAIRSISGLELLGYNERGLPRVAQGQVRLKTLAPSLDLNIRQVVTYLDTTTTVGDTLAITITDDWRYYYPPAVEIDPAKKLRYVEILVTTPTAAAVGFYADGAQIEEDRGEGPTAWASGSYNSDVGKWAGPADASMTVRQPLPLVIKGVGRGGYAQMSMKLWRSDMYGRYIEDISYWVESGKVSCSRNREITWNFDCVIKLDGWKKIRKNLDWVAPVLRMDYPDGTYSERQLGLYFVVPSSIEHTEWEGKVQLTAFDPLWLLKIMAFTGNLRTSEKGVNRMRVVRNIIESTPLMGEPGSGNWNRFDIPGDSRDFKKAREWDKKTNRLQLANEILEQMGYYPLYTTNLGIITTKRRGEERPAGSGIYTRLKDQTPVRAWVAHLPEGASVNAWIPRYSMLKSEVVGAVKTDPLALDNVDEILIVNDDPDLPRIHVKGKVKRRRKRNGDVRYVVEEPKGKTKRVYANYVEDNATAIEVATALADDLSCRVEHASVTTLPHPSLDYVHTTALFALWNARKDPVIIGQYAFDEVTWDFDLNNCKQTMQLSFVDDGDAEIEGIDLSTIPGL